MASTKHFIGSRWMHKGSEVTRVCQPHIDIHLGDGWQFGRPVELRPEKGRCGNCGGPRDYVIKSGRRAGRLNTYCAKCCVEKSQDWAKRNAARVSNGHKEWWAANPQAKIRAEMKRYGKDEHWYAEQLERQGGLCEICKGPERRKGYRLSVDHHHVTGKVRGLVCNACNRHLAPLEKTGWMAAANAYLKKYEGE